MDRPSSLCHTESRARIPSLRSAKRRFASIRSNHWHTSLRRILAFGTLICSRMLDQHWLRSNRCLSSFQNALCSHLPEGKRKTHDAEKPSGRLATRFGGQSFTSPCPLRCSSSANTPPSPAPASPNSSAPGASAASRSSTASVTPAASAGWRPGHRSAGLAGSRSGSPVAWITQTREPVGPAPGLTGGEVPLDNRLRSRWPTRSYRYGIDLRKRHFDCVNKPFTCARWATRWATICTPGRTRTCDQWVRNARLR